MHAFYAYFSDWYRRSSAPLVPALFWSPPSSSVGESVGLQNSYITRTYMHDTVAGVANHGLTFGC